MKYSPYDTAAWSTYTPMSSQEILQPAMLMRERHDKLDEEYAAIDSELQKVAFAANMEGDEDIMNRYSNYQNALTTARDDLMNNGVNSQNKRKMLDLRGKFQSEIQPISQAFEIKSKMVAQDQEMRAKDHTYLGQDPSNIKLSDIMNNGMQPMAMKGISGALLTQMATTQLAPWANRSFDEGTIKELIVSKFGDVDVNQYYEQIRNYGLAPGEPGHAILMEYVKDNILKSTQLDSWATPDQQLQARSWINMASSASIGKTDFKVIDDKMWDIFAARAKKGSEGGDMDPTIFTAKPIPGQSAENTTINEDYTKIKSNYQKLQEDKKEFHLISEKAKQDKRSEGYGKAVVAKMAEKGKLYKDDLDMTSIYNSSSSFEEFVEKYNKTSPYKEATTTGSSQQFNSDGKPNLDYNPVKAAYEYKKHLDSLPDEEREKQLMIDMQAAVEGSGINFEDVFKNISLGAVGAGMLMKAATTIAAGSTGIGVTAGGLLGGAISSTVATVAIPATALFVLRGDTNPAGPEDTVKSFWNAFASMNNSIQSTQDAIIDYSKKQGLNYSERQIDQMVINDLEYRSKLNGDAYRYNTEFIDKSAETSARQYLTNFENSGGIVRVYDGKKTKSLKAYDKDIKDYKTFEDTSNFKFNGIIPVNPNLGNKPSYEFIAREGSKTLRVSIPAMNIESTMSTPRILLNKINQGIIKPTEVQTDRGILTIVPTIQNDFIQYYIKETDRNGRERTSTIEDYLVNGIMDVGMKYFGDGVTRSEARKSSE